MTDSPNKPARPVSVRKNSTGPTDGTVGSGEKPNSGNRPRTIIVAAAATALSGLFAVIAALTLYGQHDFLTHQFGKQVITTRQITAATAAATGAFDSSQTDHGAGKVSDALKKKLNAAQDDTAKALADADITTQGKSASKAAKSAPSSSALGTTVQANLTKLQKQERSDASSSARKTPSQQLISGVVLLLITGLIAFSIWRGRYWSRWAVIAIWALSSFTGTTVAGINSLLAITADLPVPFKSAIALAALSMVAAVVLVLMPASGRFFALTRPVRQAPAGRGQRRGLFAPRVPPSQTTATTRPAAERARASEDPDRSRSKKRASNAQAVAKGADLARSRAKAASKSRRTGAES